MYSDPGIQRVAELNFRQTATLRREGVSRRALEHAIAAGELARVRRGWYAAPDAHPDLLRAVRVGGALTGPSAAALYGLWVPPDDRLHVSVAHNASRLRSAGDGPPPCIHWRSTPQPTGVIEPLPVVLRQSVDCLTGEMATVLVDSALNLGVGGLSMRDLRMEFDGLGPKHSSVLHRADRRSQSGLETLVRLRLRARGLNVRPQVFHPGVGKVDLLVGDRLVIEVDGRQHHDTDSGFSTDRRRDLVLLREGYERMRLTYANVMYQWPDTEAVILEVTRRRRHRWRSGDRPRVHVFRQGAPGRSIPTS